MNMHLDHLHNPGLRVPTLDASGTYIASPVHRAESYLALRSGSVAHNLKSGFPSQTV